MQETIQEKLTLEDIKNLFIKCLKLKDAFYKENSHGMKLSIAIGFRSQANELLDFIDELLKENINNPMPLREMRCSLISWKTSINHFV
jgi:hypothetical protein